MKELKEKELLEKAQAIWDDTISEKEVIKKLGVSYRTLKRMRKDGRIKKYRFVTPFKRGKPGRPGKNVVYSLSELVQIFCPTLL